MNVIELVLTAVALAMDAFAVSICKGLAIKKVRINDVLKIGLYFGFFQGFMPLIGYLLGGNFKDIITNYDHWIVFILLLLLGLNMIKESFENEKLDNDLSFKTILLLSLATSIDALAVGISFSFLNVNIALAILLIAMITFIISSVGVFIGSMVGEKYEKYSLIFGGVILIILGLRVLIEHLFM